MTTLNSRSPSSAARSLGVAGGVDLGQLLVDLGARAGGVGPVEADPGGAALQLLGALQRRQGEGDAGERALVLAVVRARRP